MADATPIVDSEEVVARDQRYLVRNYGRYPLVVRRARGVYLHSHPRIVATLQEQLGTLLHYSNLYYQPHQGAVAERLAALSGLPSTFFCNSGAEAVEAALKIAKGHGRARNEGAQFYTRLASLSARKDLGRHGLRSEWRELRVTPQPVPARSLEIEDAWRPLPGVSLGGLLRWRTSAGAGGEARALDVRSFGSSRAGAGRPTPARSGAATSPTTSLGAAAVLELAIRPDRRDREVEAVGPGRAVHPGAAADGGHGAFPAGVDSLFISAKTGGFFSH